MENLELSEIANNEIKILKARIKKLEKENNIELSNLKIMYKEIKSMYSLVCLIMLVNTVLICATGYLKL